MQTSSRSPTHNLSAPGKPEAGLAEWTQRIKAMQRQVDADEEEEHRRLEDDIRRSRIARARRSTGYGSRSSTPLSPLPSEDLPDDTSLIAQRQREHALAKLSGIGTGSKSSEPVSLASFIGGRASGPRLNKHAPQQDAHDPTLFDQRAVNSSTAPHPIFGRGGVAMPGLAAKGRARTEPTPEAVIAPPEPEPAPTMPSSSNGNGNGHAADGRENGRVRWEAAQESEEPAREPEVAVPRRERRNSNALRRYMDHVENRASPTSSPSLKPEPVRARTLSTPATPRSPPAASRQHASRPITPKSAAFAPSTAPASAPLHNVSPSFNTTTPLPSSKSPPTPSYAGQTSLSVSAGPKAAPAPTSPKPSSLSGVKSSPAPVSAKPAHLSGGSASASPKPVPTVHAPPSLARPVQPTPKASLFAAQPPPSAQPSPAFLRASSTPKDLTPSLTRLKGRGFVQSIVQASSQLEAQAQGQSSPTELGQLAGSGAGSGGKRLSVVDRWKAPVETQPTPVPSAPPSKKAFRRSWTAEATTPAQEKPTPRSVSNVPLVSSVPLKKEPEPKPADEGHEHEPSWRDIEAQSRNVEAQSRKAIKKTASASSLRKAPSSTSHHVRKKSSAASLRKKSSAASLVAPEPELDSARPPSPGGRPMGSSSTMFSYIKPMKTGDDTSAYSSRPTTPAAAKARSDVGMGSGAGSLRGELPTSGMPLSHLTKDRAKRPKKVALKPKARPGSRDGDSAAPTRSLEEPAAQQPQQQASSHIAFPSLVAEREAQTPAAEAPGRTKVSDRWGGQAVLGVRTVEDKSTGPPPVPEKDKKGMVGARALPGLAPTAPVLASAPSTSSSSSSVPSAPSSASKPAPASPRSPHRRRERIPSTGNRATVMDVALIMHEREASLSSASQSQSSSPTVPSADLPAAATQPRAPTPDSPVLSAPHSPALGRRSPVTVAPPIERRKSSFSSFGSLPPVSEVRTPAPTLGRKVPPPVAEDVPPVPAPPVPQKDAMPPSPTVEKKAPSVVRIEHYDAPVPKFNVATLIDAVETPRAYAPDTNISTISVEVLSVAGASANALAPNEAVVFYEGETLVVVHRFKTRTSGLVATKLWCWRGRAAGGGELEDAKLQALARRYAAPLVDVRQGAEPTELVHILGGSIAIRQGFRSLWSAENTTMHCVRLVDGNIIMDELDLAVSNLCSGFSYCLTLLGSSYVWHGRGSLPRERTAAVTYARALAADGSAIVELVEGVSDDDEMFWMMLGEREYAHADYWRWRADADQAPVASVWRACAGNAKAPLTPVEDISGEPNLHGSVFLVYCTWELFVLVGRDARGKRADVRLALAAADAMSRRLAASRPFDPPVHVLVLPSQLPLELRFHLRGLNENFLNKGDTPDHMNLIPLRDALDHLDRTSWDKSELRDADMLPLGLDASHIPS